MLSNNRTYDSGGSEPTGTVFRRNGTDRKEIMASVLNVNTVPMSELVLKIDSAEIFNYVNDMLDFIVPAVAENGGSFHEVNDAGITAFFNENCEASLIAAISMCQRSGRNKNVFFNFDSFSVGICYGPIYSGIVGSGGMNIPLTISEYTGLSHHLQTIAPKYGSHILITESAVNRTDGFFTKFHCRYLGKIRLTKNGLLEDIYDVYDGDEIDKKNSKRRSKMFFENGVRMFIDGKYTDARTHFIEVLKSDRNDKAAKEYLLLCDTCISGEEKSGRSCIEIW